MKKNTKRVLSMILTVVMISCFSCIAVSARSSDYLDAYSADVSAASGGRIIVGVSVDALGYMTQVGASSITIYKSSDQISWSPVKTYSYTNYPSMLVYIVEASFDIAFDKPFHACVGLLNLKQCTVAASLWSKSMKKELCIRAFRSACQVQGAYGMTLHSDRGSQFTSSAFRKALAQYGAVQSMSGTGRCYDNARMESFFATLKKEKLYRIRTERMPMISSRENGRLLFCFNFNTEQNHYLSLSIRLKGLAKKCYCNSLKNLVISG